VFTLRVASSSALQVMFSNGSYESTAKWETCQIFKEDILVARLVVVSVNKMPLF
jgi:hypothetical protein